MTTNPLVPVPAAEPAPSPRLRRRPSNEELAAWALAGGLIFYILFSHLVAGVVGGLGLYLILEKLAEVFARRMPHTAARPLALVLVTLVGGGVIFGAVALALSYVRHHAENLPALMTEMANILQS